MIESQEVIARGKREVPKKEERRLPQGTTSQQRKARRSPARSGGMTTVKRIAFYFRPYQLRVISVLILTIIASLLDLVNPLLTRVLFDDAIGGRDLQLLIMVGGGMILAPTVRVAVSVLQTFLNAQVGQRVMRDLRNQLFGHLLRMPFHFFTSTHSGQIQSRLSHDIAGVGNVLSSTFVNTVRNVSILVSTIVAMFFLSPLLTAISLALLPVVYTVTAKLGKVSRGISAERQESLASLTTVMQESLSVSGMLLIKIFGRQRMLEERFEKQDEELTNLSIRRQMVGVYSHMFTLWSFALVPVAAYLVAGWQLITDPDSNLTVGTLIAFTALQSRLVSGFGPITQLLDMRVELEDSLALFDRVFEYFDMPVTIADRPNAIHLDPNTLQGRIVFRNASFAYKSDDSSHTNSDSRLSAGQDEEDRGLEQLAVDMGSMARTHTSSQRWVLDDVSFEIGPGQLVALVGPSGAGKSTVTALVVRLYDVDQGAVEIDGSDVREITLSSLNQVVGMVTQETFLFHASVRENLLFAQPEATENQLIAAAKAAAIHNRITELDHGYDTIVGERGYKLSGGEKQRIAIARAILMDPRILILDEATSSLDSESERTIQHALAALFKRRTTLAVAHRLSTILQADQILVLDRGRIVERGTHAELLDRGELYAHLYEQQFAHHQVELPRTGRKYD